MRACCRLLSTRTSRRKLSSSPAASPGNAARSTLMATTCPRHRPAAMTRNFCYKAHIQLHCGAWSTCTLCLSDACSGSLSPRAKGYDREMVQCQPAPR